MSKVRLRLHAAGDYLSWDLAQETPGSELRDPFAPLDWPKRWHALRSYFPSRPNFGQWLRWEAALEEIRSASGRVSAREYSDGAEG
jgi:hypothetical protein